MKKAIFKLTLIVGGLLTASAMTAQVNDTVANACAKHLEHQFISDGQQYKALLMNTDEVAEFHTTLYGGSVYRIAACSGLSDGNLEFSIYDSEKNLLFSNKDYKNASYWDFKISNSLDCIIEAKLSGQGGQTSGRAVILIGFKQQK
jgi:hypothetical protein